ncbi:MULTISPECIES: TlpA disulfide reductase family protein [Roseobacteraceae]|uniref:TlpA family protein disulfide reductase n=1 Tax=Roseobacteraceae TaxID=2854170 RepID=UPI0013BE0C0E|nr:MULTISPECIES: TlpA disulfide reductase family protein [Roseobacteraceae]MCA0997571.1 TlpA family protein disulfide reductase [Alloyangia pacifica]NDV98972.1 TlpA family protein disulfide reductase [Salipiger sp. PrR002]NDW55925.1 TlpA family protein disulfide reductase [Salipiger sp. PrR004]
MKKLALAILYTAGVALANPALADVQSASALREGEMKKLVFHPAPKPAGTEGFIDFEGNPKALSDLEGKWALVNFWATWCAPCREEMPALSALQKDMGGDSFEVVTIATGRNPPPAMQSFFDEIGVDNLPLNRDPKSKLARQMAVLGLPVSVILNPEGEEVARLTGDVDWASENARAVLAALIGGES